MKTLIERLLAGLQFILPHHFLSRIVYAIMRCKTPWVKDFLITTISKAVGINASEALSPDKDDYESFNAWFTRALKPGVRTFERDPSALLSPCDGRISETGYLHLNRILQAKGKDYSVNDLLANDEVSGQFNNGYFSTIYLSPRDYHRVHMPLAGQLKRMIHVPGRIFSVAPYTTRHVDQLFARNERVICIFETAHGPLAMVLVGAMLVSSTETVWAGEITPNKNKSITVLNYAEDEVRLDKGEEMGRFNMGSTVVMLLPAKTVTDLAGNGAGDPVKVGQRLANLK